MDGYVVTTAERKGDDISGSCAWRIIKSAIEHCHPKKEAETRVKSYNAFHFVMDGKGIIEKDGQTHHIGKGEYFLLYEGEQYTYYPVSNNPWSYAYVDFYADGAEDILKDCGFDKKSFIGKKKCDDLFRVMWELVNAFKDRAIAPLRQEGLFILLLSQLMKINGKYSSASGADVPKKKLCEEILVYINNNFRMNITMDTIATAMGFSKSYISAVVSREIGLSPVQYLNYIRIASACEQIQNTDKSLKEIAFEVGYTDPLYFSRIFTKIKHISPREYRMQGKDDDPYAFLREKNIDFC